MIKEDRELLMKDLSCRIPYGVFVKIDGMSKIVKLTSISCYGEVSVDDGSNYLYPISEVKPYLFPLSSMTDEQEKEYNGTLGVVFNIDDGTFFEEDKTHYTLDWLNKNHFDYRGLIYEGLAIDATGLNIY